MKNCSSPIPWDIQGIYYEGMNGKERECVDFKKNT